MKNSRKSPLRDLALGSVMAALCVAVLALGSVVGVMDVSAAALAGIILAVLRAEFGEKLAFAVFVTAGAISMLLPGRTPGFLFLAFAGWYPIIQTRIDRIPRLWARCLKLILFNLAFGAVLFFTEWLTGASESWGLRLTLLLIGNAVFTLYDVLLSRLVVFYYVKIRPRLGF